MFRRLLILSFSFVFFAPLLKWAEELRPRIQFPEQEHHFGEIAQGSKVSYKFAFKNEGNAPLMVSKVETSCGCTAAVAGKNELAPGESSEIEATFNSTGRFGQFRKGIQVYSNDPQAPKVELFVDGMIKTLLEVEPRVLNLGLVKAGETVEREIKIKTNAYDKPLRITQIDKSAQLEVAFKDEPITRNAWTNIQVKFKAGATGSLNERVTLHFDDPAIAPTMIPVMGRAEGSIRVIPPRLNFIVRENVTHPPAIGEARGPTQRVQLVRTDTSHFQIVKVELDPEIFDVQTVVKEEGRSYELVVHLKGATKEKVLSRTLRIFTNDESMKVIEIPVQVWAPAVS